MRIRVKIQVHFSVRHSACLMNCLILSVCLPVTGQTTESGAGRVLRERVSINADWRFFKYASADKADDLIYDVRPEAGDYRDDRPADRGKRPARPDRL
jgi:hypothetical protein